MNIQRWSKGIRELERMPTQMFSLAGYWRDDHDCDSVGCVRGWCATWFKDEGVRLDIAGCPLFPEGTVFGLEFFGVTLDEMRALTDGRPEVRRSHSELCGLPGDADCDSNNDPRAVARRMRLLAAKYGPTVIEEEPQQFSPEVESICAAFNPEPVALPV